MEFVRKYLLENIKLTSLGICVAGVSILAYRRCVSKSRTHAVERVARVCGVDYPKDTVIVRTFSKGDYAPSLGHLVVKLERVARVCGVDYPKDTVIVRTFSKGDYAPSLGHFVVKLETYLRVAKIPYQEEYGTDMGPKSKIPWMEYNGVTMGDSQLIIEYLNKELNVDLNASLSRQQRGIAWGIQKWLEEFTYHLNVYTRWVLLSEELHTVVPSLPASAFPIVKKRTNEKEYIIGIGRHTAAEVHEMMVGNLRQFSAILGDNKFVMGGEEPTEVDCAAFGMLSQVRWHTPDSCPGKQVLTRELTNVMTYLDRIKQLYWPDWDECITGGQPAH